MEEKDSIRDYIMGCQESCHVVRQERSRSDDLEKIIEDLKKQVKEKDRKIRRYETVKNYIKNELREEIIDEFFKEFTEFLESNIPIYNYIRNKITSFERIKAVFLYNKEELYDLWFIIEENDFDLKHKISEIFCEIVENFDSLVFDIMVLTVDDVNIEKLREESYKTIYIKN